MRMGLLTLLAGAAMGFALSRAGFTKWEEMHGMLAFTSFRLLLAFSTAVVVLTFVWQVVRRVAKVQWKPRRIHPGSIAGGVLFGVGLAVSGACPSIAFTQLGEGQLAAVVTVIGIVAGNWLYSIVHAKFFRWSPGVCTED